MKYTKWMVPALIVAAVSLGGCDLEELAGMGAVEEAPARPSPVRVQEVSELTLPLEAVYTGTIEAWEQAHITAQAGQRIERLPVREGDRVRRGQVVAVMDDANVRQAEVEVRMATNERDRLERLVAIGAVARQQLEQAEAHLETAQTNIEVLRRNTSLTAPIEGVVTEKYYVAGEVFGGQAPALLTIQQVDPLKVVIHVAERYFPVVRPGMGATIGLDTFPDLEFHGEVERVNPTITPESRTFRVEVRVENDEARLSPGMFARVGLDLGETTGEFLPRRAVQSTPGSGEHFVYVVEEGRARRVALEVGEQVDQYRRVISGLGEGDQVVVEGLGRLHDGAAVQVLEGGGER